MFGFADGWQGFKEFDAGAHIVQEKWADRYTSRERCAVSELHAQWSKFRKGHFDAKPLAGFRRILALKSDKQNAVCHWSNIIQGGNLISFAVDADDSTHQRAFDGSPRETCLNGNSQRTDPGDRKLALQKQLWLNDDAADSARNAERATSVFQEFQAGHSGRDNEFEIIRGLIEVSPLDSDFRDADWQPFRPAECTGFRFIDSDDESEAGLLHECAVTQECEFPEFTTQRQSTDGQGRAQLVKRHQFFGGSGCRINQQVFRVNGQVCSELDVQFVGIELEPLKLAIFEVDRGFDGVGVRVFGTINNCGGK